MLSEAVDRGIPVHHDTDGEPNGINLPMPKNDELVGELVAAAGSTMGAAIYVHQSQITHAVPSALTQYFTKSDILQHPHLQALEPALSDKSLLGTCSVVLLAMLESFRRFVVMYGWDEATWGSWSVHVARRAGELNQRLDATKGDK